MFVTRLISGIVLVGLALLTICTGNWLLFFTVLALSLIGANELYKVMKVRPENSKFSILELAGYVGICLYYASLVVADGKYTLGALMAAIILIMFVYVFSYPAFHANQIMAAFFGISYVAVMLSCVYQTRMLEGGAYHVWLIFLCSWGCDTCAYCVGKLSSQVHKNHQMAPVLSPKKSVEGAVGGVVGAVLLGLIYAMATQGPVAVYMIICGVGGLISMVGDLAASAIKRNMGIKDYGKLIPGHGGVLDRFDSVIFTAPVIFYLSSILI